jgi:hypothetical protein
MRKIVKISLFAIFFALLYSIFWYIATISLCSQVNKHAKSAIATQIMGANVTFSFEKVTPHGFPFKIGCKIIGLHEDTDSYVILHNGIVVFGYDILKKGLFFSNNGQSIAKIKPEVSGFGVKVISNNSYFFKMPISTRLLRILNKDTAEFEWFNFVKNIQINAANIQAHDLIDNSLIFDHELTRAKFSWEGDYYYRTFEDLQNHIPSKYSLNLDVIIKNVVNNKKIIAPFSPVYFFLPNSKFDVSIIAQVDTKAQKANLLDIVQNSSVNFEKFEYSDSSVSSDFKGLLSLEASDARESGVFNFTLAANFNSLELARIYSEKIWPQFADDLDGPAVMSQDQKDWLANLQNTQYELNMIAHGDYAFGKKLKNLNLESLQFVLNDTGFNLHGKSSFSSELNWYVDGNLILFNYPAIVASLIDTANKYKQYNISSGGNANSENVVKNIMQSEGAINNLLKQISNHPESISSDLAIDFQFSHNLNSSKIGSLPLGLFLENCSKILNPK